MFCFRKGIHNKPEDLVAVRRLALRSDNSELMYHEGRIRFVLSKMKVWKEVTEPKLVSSRVLSIPTRLRILYGKHSFSTMPLTPVFFSHTPIDRPH